MLVKVMKDTHNISLNYRPTRTVKSNREAIGAVIPSCPLVTIHVDLLISPKDKQKAEGSKSDKEISFPPFYSYNPLNRPRVRYNTNGASLTTFNSRP
jgi:hypothetical protein